MRAGLRGSPQTLARFSQELRRLPRVVAQKVTAAAAPVITDLARATFNASQTAEGIPWAPGADGQRVTLRKSGALARRVHYVGIGTKLRVALGVAYAKFQIGRRPVFPSQGSPLPAAYAEALHQVAVAVVRAEMRGQS